jgi:hypothetical protein
MALIESKFNFRANMAQFVVCNFAIHYFCGNSDTIKNFLSLVSSMLKIGGVFMFTTMNGKAVFDLLSGLALGESWKALEGDVVKYEIKKLYAGDTFAKTGQTIAIKLPFSEKLYEEPLASIDMIVSEAKKFDLEVEINSNFSSYASKPNLPKLNAMDAHYISLHTIVTLRKLK